MIVESQTFNTLEVQAFFDSRTSTVTYLCVDSASNEALVIDPVLDYDPNASRLWSESVDTVLNEIEKRGLRVVRILETHAHADHLSGAREIQKKHEHAPVCIGEGIRDVQRIFRDVFSLGDHFPIDGRQFDMLLPDSDRFSLGAIECHVISTPGHTPACVSYVVGDFVFVGDLLFMPDQGTGRCDFPGGSAEDMYDSAQKIYAMDGAYRVCVGHDYQPGGRDVRWHASVQEQRDNNLQLPASVSKQTFINKRQARDSTLSAPRLLFQSVQVNIDGGRLPISDGKGKTFLKIPINAFLPDVDLRHNESNEDDSSRQAERNTAQCPHVSVDVVDSALNMDLSKTSRRVVPGLTSGCVNREPEA